MSFEFPSEEIFYDDENPIDPKQGIWSSLKLLSKEALTRMLNKIEGVRQTAAFKS